MARKNRKQANKPKARLGISTLLLLLILIAGFAMKMSDLQMEVAAAESQYVELEAQVQAQIQYNESMQESIDEGGTDAQMQQIAREELGLVTPGEKIFYDVSN